MAWQNPKTNWVAGDIPGAGDFNRIEGNTAYLKTQTDGLKNGSIKAGNAVKLNGQSPSYYAKQAELDALKQAKYMHQQTLNFTGAGTVIVTHGLGTTDVLVTLLLSNEGYWVPASTNVRFRIVDENRVAVQSVTTASRTIRCVIIRTI